MDSKVGESAAQPGATTHIVCCFDYRFEAPFVVLANSIQRHTKGPVTIHALHDGPLYLAPRLARTIDGLEIRYRDISSEYQKLATLGPQSSVTYARMDLPEILPDLERAIYIDVDAIVLHDLSELYAVDLGDRALAAVVDHVLVGVLPHQGEDFGPEGNRWNVERYLTSVVGMKDWRRYFNAGVLLMDLRRMKESGAIERAREFLRQTRERAINNDQDALNHALNGEFVELDPRWNCIANYTDPSVFATATGRLREVGALWQDPWLLHYAGLKPWDNFAQLTRPTELFWAEALGSKAAWPMIRFFLSTVKGLGRWDLSRALWELRNRGPRLSLAQIARCFVSYHTGLPL